MRFTVECRACKITKDLPDEQAVEEWKKRHAHENHSSTKKSKSRVELADDQLLEGLWWGDPEFEPLALEVWKEYVEARNAWEERKKAYATVLRYFLQRADEKPYSCDLHPGQLLQVPGGCPACAMTDGVVT
jgi:hypothetical protein